MQTQLLASLLGKEQSDTADRILRSCVHCGFCTATCPTYQLLGDELDGPRGRIYLIKQVLEGQQATKRTQQHLDRCLTCRSCETTCPSGVRYVQLLEIGKTIVHQQVGRHVWERFLRKMLRLILPYPRRFSALLQIGSWMKPLLPTSLKKQIPVIEKTQSWNHQSQAKKILVLEGCVQSAVTPDTNAIASQIFAKLGYQMIRVNNAVCCGAVSTHLSAIEEGKEFMRRNIDAWWPSIEKGVEAILATASGCGVMLIDYADALQDDPLYAEKAKVVSRLVRDPVDMLMNEDLSRLSIEPRDEKIAFHSPCTQQHGLKLQGVVEDLLSQLGFHLVSVEDSHLCCGSAGTYSILEAKLSHQLLEKKISALTQQKPDMIVTANIGCQLHLQTQSDVPVKHWLSLLI